MQTVLPEKSIQATAAAAAADRSERLYEADHSPSGTENKVARYAWGVTRISIGFVFLWAFLDKLLALGYATGKDPKTGVIDRFGPAAWIHDGSPTNGFLMNVKGPFKGLFKPMAGATWANWLFMIGLLAIGVALMLGIGMRIAAGSGALLLVFMWMALLPLSNNPFMDDHLIYAVVLVGLAAVHAGDIFGFGRSWARSDIVQRYPILR